MIGLLVLMSMLVIVAIGTLLIISLFAYPMSWYWVLSPIWISWIIITVAFVIFAPIAVYLSDKSKPK